MDKNLKDWIGREEFCEDVIDELRIKQALSFINTKIKNNNLPILFHLFFANKNLIFYEILSLTLSKKKLITPAYNLDKIVFALTVVVGFLEEATRLEGVDAENGPGLD